MSIEDTRVEVNQIDRDALDEIWHLSLLMSVRGQRDDEPFLQILARHRLAALALPAPVIEREVGLAFIDEHCAGPKDSPLTVCSSPSLAAWNDFRAALREQSPTPSVRARALEEAATVGHFTDLIMRYTHEVHRPNAQAAAEEIFSAIRALAEGEG